MGWVIDPIIKSVLFDDFKMVGESSTHLTFLLCRVAILIGPIEHDVDASNRITLTRGERADPLLLTKVRTPREARLDLVHGLQETAGRIDQFPGHKWESWHIPLALRKTIRLDPDNEVEGS